MTLGEINNNISTNKANSLFLFTILFFIVVSFYFNSHRIKIEPPKPISFQDSLLQRDQKAFIENKKREDSGVERVIAKMKLNGGYMSRQNMYDKPYFHDPLFAEIGFRNMVALGLIKQKDPTDADSYVLTEKGFSFRGFKTIDKIDSLQIVKLELDVENAKNSNRTFWIPMAVSVMSLLVSFYTLYNQGKNRNN